MVNLALCKSIINIPEKLVATFKKQCKVTLCKADKRLLQHLEKHLHNSKVLLFYYTERKAKQARNFFFNILLANLLTQVNAVEEIKRGKNMQKISVEDVPAEKISAQ